MIESGASDPKPFYKSWTVLAHLALLALVLSPGWKKWISQNPDAYVLVHSLLAIFLRWVTTQAITLRLR
jgi:hypothetical protein